MFKIKGSTIHCSRGDGGTIALKLPFTDSNDYVKYVDSEEKIYWYDTKKKVLYDEDYNETDIDIKTLNIVYYIFSVGDVIRLNIYNKNGYNREILKEKEITITEECEEVDINITEEDSTFGAISNKEITYWYDVTLNRDNTVVGYDEEGAKEFIMYPAKGLNE